MLQIVRKTVLGIVLLLGCAFSDTSGSFQWLLEDALEDDFVALFAPNVVGPEELEQAIAAYHKGDYASALYYLERLQDYRLPDGTLDFLVFIVAECYRMHGLRKHALDNYRYICRHFPESDKVSACIFRSIQFAYETRDIEAADSLFNVFHQRYQTHPLFTAVLYVIGKTYYRVGRYGEAYGLLERIPRNSSRYIQSQFLSALCRCELKEWDDALKQLEYVRTKATDKAFVNEATIVIADIYAMQGKYDSAIDFYRTVGKASPRYHYVLVKQAQVHLLAERYHDAEAIAKSFVENHSDSDYYFEMASILEQVYDKLGDIVKKRKISNKVFQELLAFRLSFEIAEERNRVSELVREWESLSEHDENARALRAEIDENVAKLRDLDHKLKEHLESLGIEENRAVISESEAAERRYLALLKDSITVFDDSLEDAQTEVQRIQRIVGVDSTTDSMPPAVKRARESLDTIVALREAYQEEYELVLDEFFGDRLDREKRMQDERQAQFIDWTFRKYQDKKQELVELNRKLAAREEAMRDSSDSAAGDSDMKARLSKSARNKLEQQVVQDRKRLASLTETLVDINPGSPYNAKMLMRLAELHYDEATDEFAVKLREYEAKMAEGADESDLSFPEMDLGEAIEVYNTIIKQYPRNDVADMALFYKSLALQKEGKDSAANAVLLEHIERYPESPYFVEANMSIGRYYFDHPMVQDGEGYVLAEEAFRRVLYYRDHPQFVQALYHLGWCYYMQDEYEEAIAVFRYLVEEVDLDFSKARSEEMQVTNPLLREEAIDYIAISFDERGEFEEAVRFLRLIGSFDYSSVVLKRMGELREEVQDYDAALEVYKFLEAEYPVTIAAPDAALNVIKLYELKKERDLALKERQRFFQRFGRGSEWQERYSELDSATAARVDSIAVVAGLFVGDAYYREATESGNQELYQQAARNYLQIVQKYDDGAEAHTAQWNLAVILEKHLGQPKAAYTHYITYSQREEADTSRREQAALNAVAIAQNLLPPDSVEAQEGAVEMATVKLIEAVDNYVNVFPDGESKSSVLLAQASVFYSREMYSNAASIYQDIIAAGGESEEYYEALYMLGLSRFEEDKWNEAAQHFKKVWSGSPDPAQRQEAYRVLLQSKYLAAKKLMAAQKFEQAAEALLAIEQEYPGSEYGDIVFFNAAEALERLEKWKEAAEAYTNLVMKYPSSKYAPDALFNAATDLEKANDFRRAAEVYDQLVTQYPDSPKAKDALFNMGFCYEKLGKPEKMAEAQERYSRLYPGEKDVEVLLMRSGEYYLKAGLNEKALAVFKTYTVRYPRSDRAVEATFKMGRAYEAMHDQQNARLQYLAAMKLDEQLVAAGGAGNSYYAAEGAYYLARMQEDQFEGVELTLPPKKLKQQQKKKVELLTEAATAYQRVIEYQSERMFEATYRIGHLYDQLTKTWLNQERQRLDPIKQAVFEKELYTTAYSLLQQSFVPYRKALELAGEFDSLGMEQKHWIGKARENLLRNYMKAGEHLESAMVTMLEAPIPKNIQEKPVYLVQYLKQLHETVEPLKRNARDYYASACEQLKELGLGGETYDKCRMAFGRLNFMLGGDYAALAKRSLDLASELPDNMDEIEREEIVFQLEDMVFELQDKAIILHEEAKSVAEERDMVDGVWYQRIVKSLAKLDPDRYGEQFFVLAAFPSDDSWPIRPDSVENWNKPEAPREGWFEPEKLKRARPGMFPQERPVLLGRSDSVTAGFYLRKHIVLAGKPRGGAVYVAATAPYELFVNGMLTLNDTTIGRPAGQVDSAVGIVSLLQGGDNVIACRVHSQDSAPAGVAVMLTAMLDTSVHFEAEAEDIRLGRQREEVAEPAEEEPEQQEAPVAGESESVEETQEAAETETEPAPVATKSRQAVRAATRTAKNRRAEALDAAKKEQFEIQKQQVLLNAVKVQIQMLKKEIERLEAKEADTE